MAKFLPGSKITKLRRNLTLFIQEDGGSLYGAWERYSKILNLCHNHGYAEHVILHMVYHGINNELSIFDLSAGGHFMSLTLEEGQALIEKIMIVKEKWNVDETMKPTKNIYCV